MAQKFCAVRRSIAVGARRYFIGYLCDCVTHKVVQVDATMFFLDDLTELADPPNMPAEGDDCDCAASHCRDLRLAVPPAAGGGAAPVMPEEFSPCDIQVPFPLQVLGQWNVASSLYPEGFLRLLMLGTPERNRYIVFGIGLFFTQSCLGDSAVPWIDDDAIEYAADDSACWIGTESGYQIGPFSLEPIPSP